MAQPQFDYSKMSDEELSALAMGEMPTAKPTPRPTPSGLSAPRPRGTPVPANSLQMVPDMAKLGEEELKLLAAGKPLSHVDEASGALGALASGIKVFGDKVNAYTGAPSRAFVGAIQDGANPFKAFGKQWGAETDTAPTGEDIVKKAGISDRPIYDVSDESFEYLQDTDPMAARDLEGWRHITRSGAAGVAVDFGADWTNLLPVSPKAVALGGKALGGALEMTGKGALGAAKMLGKGVVAAEGATTGTKVIETTGQVAGNIIKESKAALDKIVRPYQAADFPDLVRVAEANGIDKSLLPESIEFGESSLLSREARAAREGVMGEAALQRFHDGHAQVQDAFNRRIARVGGGPPPSPVQAGSIIRQGYDDAVKRFFESRDVTYSSIMKAFPGLRIEPKSAAAIESKLAGVEKAAKGLQMRGITSGRAEQGNQLIRAVEAIRRGNGSYKQTLEAMQNLGEVAFGAPKSAAETRVDVEKMRDLYFTLSDALVESVRKAEAMPAFAKKNGAVSIADELVANNKAIHEFINKKGVVSDIITNERLAPEEVFQSILLRGNSEEIGVLRELLTPEQLQKLKGAFLENLVRRDPDGAFNFRTLYSAIRNKGTVVSSLFTPQEIEEIGGLVKLGDRFGSPVLSSSGTGASNSFLDIPKSIANSVINRAIVDPLKVTARARGPAPATSAVERRLQELGKGMKSAGK